MDDSLAVIIGGIDLVEAHTFDAQGQSMGAALVVGNGGDTKDVRVARSGLGLVVTWLGDESVLAQRINSDGQLGGEACNPADLSRDGELDFFDVSAFLNAFGAMNLVADFNNDSKFDFFDISAFLTIFSEGCP